MRNRGRAAEASEGKAYAISTLYKNLPLKAPLPLGGMHGVEPGGDVPGPPDWGAITRHAGDPRRRGLNLAADAAILPPGARPQHADHQRDAEPPPACLPLHGQCPTFVLCRATPAPLTTCQPS